MSTPRWLRDYWWLGIGLAVFAFGAWTANLQADVLELQRKVDAVQEVRAFALALGRLACMDNYNRAYTAGLPCDPLLKSLRGMP
jgi:hypothetical protein